MQTRMRWACAIGTALFGVVIAAGCLLGANALHERSVALLTSAYDEAANPDIPTEEEWDAMSWEEKRQCKQRFEEEYRRRLQRSDFLDFGAFLGWIGAVFSACISICASVQILKWRPSCDSAAP